VTNLLATISVLFSTNSVVHWPQKWIEDTSRPPLYSTTEAIIGGKTTWTYPSNPVDDTNADTRTIETTATARRLLSFECDGHRELELTNWTQAHWSVDEQRVRTNAWLTFDGFHIPESIEAVATRNGKLYGSFPTNYFVPVRTNK
jgi:hypothetical protein